MSIKTNNTLLPKQSKALDYFKLFAAFLVIAIHTSPLAGINATADFVLTRIFARIAVPFFLMVSGFFLLPQYLFDKSADFCRLRTFLKKNLSTVSFSCFALSARQFLCRTFSGCRNMGYPADAFV